MPVADWNGFSEWKPRVQVEREFGENDAFEILVCG